MTFNWENIVRSAIRNTLPAGDDAFVRFEYCKGGKMSNWHIVAELCGVGATSAQEICKHFGIDPHAKTPETKVDRIARKCGKEMDDQTQGPSETCCHMWANIEEESGLS